MTEPSLSDPDREASEKKVSRYLGIATILIPATAIINALQVLRVHFPFEVFPPIIWLIGTLSLFFVLNLAYFLFPVIQLFNASLNTQLRTPLARFYKGIVTSKAVAMDMDLASFSLVYNLKTVTFAKLMVMVFVVISSLPLNILYRKRNRFFIDHVGYMVELACFNLFLNAIVLSVLAAIPGVGKHLDELSLTLIEMHDDKETT